MNAATKASNDTLMAFRAAERQRDKQLEAAVEGELLHTTACMHAFCAATQPVTT
jgi:hypothetical protein